MRKTLPVLNWLRVQQIEMRWRSYKRWGFKDPQKQDQYWIQPQHPLYMESARTIEPDVQAWGPHRD